MRNSQAGCDPQGRSGPSAGRVPNSPANPLPTAFYSAAGRLGQIVYKLLIGRVFSTLTGGASGAERRFLPEGREVRADRAACRRATDFANHRLGRSARQMPGRVKVALLRILVRDHAGLGRPTDRKTPVVPARAALGSVEGRYEVDRLGIRFERQKAAGKAE